MASVPPTGRQGGILPTPLPQSATVPVNAKTTDTSGADSGQIGHTMVKERCLELENYIRAGKCRKNRDNKVVLPSGGYIPQYPEKLYYKDRLEEWHRLNPSNLATGNLSANAAPDAQQQQAMNNMQAPAAATLVHEIVQEPRVDQYVLTTNKRIEYHPQELLKLQNAPTLFASDSFSAALTADVFKADVPKRKGVQTKKKYKPVTLKVKPVASTVPEDFFA
ncbi:hypothetical protein C0995_013421 [Termitomyces sp. Mi166|nr:hypothetical protein C0995_013421 [Termitomyces sp. Mi166\